MAVLNVQQSVWTTNMQTIVLAKKRLAKCVDMTAEKQDFVLVLSTGRVNLNKKEIKRTNKKKL
jgi:hypothetical protein